MSLLDRYGKSAPAAIRDMVAHAYLRSRDQSAEVRFEALADVGEFHKLFPDLPKIEVHPNAGITEPSVRCPNVIPVGWHRQ